MTSPLRKRGGQAGFTLLEMTIVLVVLALVSGLVLTRAPHRGGAVDLRAATAVVAGSLRVARSRAIARNASVPVRFDAGAGAIQLGADPVRRLPPGVEIGGTGTAAIVFRPDGSATGGSVDLLGTADRARISVSWITGRVTVADGRAAP